MSDFFRRASDAFHRQRQDSTGSVETPTSPDAAKSPEALGTKQRTGSEQSESHVNEAFAGTATTDTVQPKKHHPWGWRHHQENPKGSEKKEPSSGQGKKDDLDWVVAS